MVQLGSSEIAWQVSGHSWKTQHYVNNNNGVNVNASVHGFHKRDWWTVTFFWKKMYQRGTVGWLLLAAMFSIYTPRSAIPGCKNVGCGHCWLTCMDRLRNSGGGGDSVGEVAIFRLRCQKHGFQHEWEYNSQSVRVLLELCNGKKLQMWGSSSSSSSSPPSSSPAWPRG